MMGNYLEAENLVAEAIEGGAYADFPLLSTQLAEIKRMTGQSRAALDILQQAIGGNAERRCEAWFSTAASSNLPDSRDSGGRCSTEWFSYNAGWCSALRMLRWSHWPVGCWAIFMMPTACLMRPPEQTPIILRPTPSGLTFSGEIQRSRC